MLRKYASIAVLFVIALLLAPMAAMAQATDTTVNAGSIFGIFQPYIVEVVSVIVAFFVAWLSAKITKLTGLQIEGKHREALQSALQNGANYGVNKAGNYFGGLEIDVKNKALAEGVSYVLSSVPDAVAYFGLTPQKVRELVEAKLPVVTPLIASSDVIGTLDSVTVPPTNG